MPDPDREHHVIELFCSRMQQLEQIDWSVVDYPDDGIADGACDGLILRDGARWVVEHSRLEVFEGEGRDTALLERWVLPAVPAIEKAFPGETIKVGVRVRELGSVKRGSMRDGDRAAAFEREILTAIAETPASERRKISAVRQLQESGFAVRLARYRSAKAWCSVWRLDPSEESFVAALREKLEKKLGKLARAAEDGIPGILLLDAESHSCFEDVYVWEGFGKAAEGLDTAAIREAFAVNDSSGSSRVWPLRYRGVEYPDDGWLSEFDRALGAIEWGAEIEGPPFLERARVREGED